MSQALTVKPATEKEILKALAVADDRELQDEAENDKFMPYDIAFQARAQLVAVKQKNNYDNSGLFITFRITESNHPELKVGKMYTQTFFDTHKTIPEFVLKQTPRKKLEFAAAVAGEDPDNREFKAAPVLLKLHREVESLEIPMLIENKYLRKTRNGKAVHDFRCALDKG